MSTQPLTISQGALLPMPPVRPVQTDTGYTETPESLTTTGYTDRPAEQPRIVQYPHPSGDPTKPGPVVAFPSSMSDSEFAQAAKRSWDFLKNEVKGAGQMVMGLPSAIADSVTVAPTADEQKSLGVPANPSLAEKAALALYRNLGEPIENATQFYATLVRHHQNIIDAIPQDVLAQGLGAGAGAAVLGKVLAPAEAGGVPVAGTPVTEIGKQLAVREHGEAGLPGTVGEPFTREEQTATPTPANTTNENVTGRNARRTEPVQTVIPGTGVEEVHPDEVDNRPDVPTFYSKVAKLVDEKVKGKSGNGDQILATLRNSGAKEDEIKWLGLDDYLKDKPKVSKADLQQFINDNQIQLGEVNRTAAAEARGAMQAEQNQLHDYITAVQGRNADSSLGKALTQWLADEGPESTSKLLSHPDMTPELASQVARWDQLEEQLKGTEGKPAKFSKYVLDGPKDNYTEKLMTLPQKNAPVPSTAAADAFRAYQDDLVSKYGRNENSSSGVHLSKATGDETDKFYGLQAKAREEAGANQRLQESSGQYKGPHFEEPNILAHIRHDDRIDTEGKKNLFLEEVQSDWHQAGKQEGYRTPVDKTELARQLDNANDVYQTKSKALAANPEDAQAKADARAAFQETQRLERAYNAAAAQRGVPEAPFKNDWHELAMKRMLREAVEKGYDRMSWTTGEQQAERYDLSKHIGRVTYDPTDNTLQAFDPSGNNVLTETVDPDADELAKYIGKEPAQKLAKQIDNYVPASPQEFDYDHAYEWASGQYDVREIEPENDDEEPRYGLFADWQGDTPLEVHDTEREAERARERYIESDVSSDAENFEPDTDEPDLPEVSGLDLKVGGEWAHNLYDRAIPNFMNKYLKKWGGKVGTTYIPVGEGEKGGLNYHLIAPNGELYDAFRTRQQAEDALKSVSQPGSATRWQILDQSPEDEKVHSIDITPAMKKSIMKEGQPIAKAEQPSWQDIALSKLGNQAA
jgi:hypothetical protein